MEALRWRQDRIRNPSMKVVGKDERDLEIRMAELEEEQSYESGCVLYDPVTDPITEKDDGPTPGVEVLNDEVHGYGQAEKDIDDRSIADQTGDTDNVLVAA